MLGHNYIIEEYSIAVKKLILLNKKKFLENSVYIDPKTLEVNVKNNKSSKVFIDFQMTVVMRRFVKPFIKELRNSSFNQWGWIGYSINECKEQTEKDGYEGAYSRNKLIPMIFLNNFSTSTLIHEHTHLFQDQKDKVDNIFNKSQVYNMLSRTYKMNAKENEISSLLFNDLKNKWSTDSNFGFGFGLLSLYASFLGDCLYRLAPNEIDASIAQSSYELRRSVRDKKIKHNDYNAILEEFKKTSVYERYKHNLDSFENLKELLDKKKNKKADIIHFVSRIKYVLKLIQKEKGKFDLSKIQFSKEEKYTKYWIFRLFKKEYTREIYTYDLYTYEKAMKYIEKLLSNIIRRNEKMLNKASKIITNLDDYEKKNNVNRNGYSEHVVFDLM